MRLLSLPGKMRFDRSRPSRLIAPDGFMTDRRSLFQRTSHHCDRMLHRIHVFVGSDDSSRLPDLCGESATEFACSLKQKGAQGVLVRRLLNLASSRIVHAALFFG